LFQSNNKLESLNLICAFKPYHSVLTSPFKMMLQNHGLRVLLRLLARSLPPPCLAELFGCLMNVAADVGGKGIRDGGGGGGGGGGGCSGGGGGDDDDNDDDDDGDDDDVGIDVVV
jgi:hypothetical protein